MKNLEKKLKRIAIEVRKLVIEVANKSRSAHVGPTFSCVDILVYLYFHELRIDESQFESRDIFVLSKAHAAMGLYAVLNRKGFLDEKKFWGYYGNDGTLPAHLDRSTNKWIETSGGSLGHGFNIALGMAHGYKLKGDKRNVYTLIGDGESQEGSIWEGALFAPKLGIDNIPVILDRNDMQGYGRPSEICSYEDIGGKWRAFGWEVYRINGHNFMEINNTFKKNNNGKPKIIIANTIKGKGVSFMEDEQKWHYYIVTDELKENALTELNKEYSANYDY